MSSLLPDCGVDLEHCMILDAYFELQDFIQTCIKLRIQFRQLYKYVER